MSGEVERLTFAMHAMLAVSGNGSNPVPTPAYIRRDDLEYIIARVQRLEAALDNLRAQAVAGPDDLWVSIPAIEWESTFAALEAK